MSRLENKQTYSDPADDDRLVLDVHYGRLPESIDYEESKRTLKKALPLVKSYNKPKKKLKKELPLELSPTTPKDELLSGLLYLHSLIHTEFEITDTQPLPKGLMAVPKSLISHAILPHLSLGNLLAVSHVNKYFFNLIGKDEKLIIEKLTISQISKSNIGDAFQQPENKLYEVYQRRVDRNLCCTFACFFTAFALGISAYVVSPKAQYDDNHKSIYIGIGAGVAFLLALICCCKRLKNIDKRDSSDYGRTYKYRVLTQLILFKKNGGLLSDSDKNKEIKGQVLNS